MEFVLSMRFENNIQSKYTVQSYAICDERNIEWVREGRKLEAICDSTILRPWRICGSWHHNDISFVVKSLGGKQIYPRALSNQ